MMHHNTLLQYTYIVRKNVTKNRDFSSNFVLLYLTWCLHEFESHKLYSVYAELGCIDFKKTVGEYENNEHIQYNK
jgi:hypothetical protein